MAKATIHYLYLTKLHVKNVISSYPTGNFGGNQLLDCSSGLSPLYLTQTSDLHVSIVSRSSTRVSSGFYQFKYSSQSFGSQHNNLSPPRQASEGIMRGSRHEKFVFTAQCAFKGRYVRYYTRLLGSCFKTSGTHNQKKVNVKAKKPSQTRMRLLLNGRVFPFINTLVSRSFNTHLERSFHLSFTVLVLYWHLTRYLALGAL